MADYFCNEDVDGVCNGCGNCRVEDCADTNPATGEQFYNEDEDGGPTWEQEWEDFGEVGSETIEYL